MPRVPRRSVLVGIIVLGVGAAAFAQSVRLQYRYRQGERLRYDVTLKGNGTISSATLGQNDPFEMSGKLTYVSEVQRVDGTGNATVHTVVEDSSINATWGGQAIPISLNLPAITAKIAPTGKILSATVAGGASQQLPALGLSGPGAATQAFDFTKFFGTTQSVGFPTQPVSAGSEWTDSVTVTTADGTKLNIRSTCKLLGFVTYQGRQCAKIRTSFTVPLSMQMVQLGIPFTLSGSEEGTMTTYFAPTEGRMIASTGKVVGDMTMSGTVGVGAGPQQTVAVSMQSQTDVRVNLSSSRSAAGRR